MTKTVEVHAGLYTQFLKYQAVRHLANLANRRKDDDARVILDTTRTAFVKEANSAMPLTLAETEAKKAELAKLAQDLNGAGRHYTMVEDFSQFDLEFYGYVVNFLDTAVGTDWNFFLADTDWVAEVSRLVERTVEYNKKPSFITQVRYELALNKLRFAAERAKNKGIDVTSALYSAQQYLDYYYPESARQKYENTLGGY